MTRDDIMHLEYMENPEILRKAKIEPYYTFKEKRVFLFWKKKTNEVIDCHYNNKQNLTKYLSAWVEILQEEVTEPGTKEGLRALELQAVAEGNFEAAARYRDQIA